MSFGSAVGPFTRAEIESRSKRTNKCLSRFQTLPYIKKKLLPRLSDLSRFVFIDSIRVPEIHCPRRKSPVVYALKLNYSSVDRMLASGLVYSSKLRPIARTLHTKRHSELEFSGDFPFPALRKLQDCIKRPIRKCSHSVFARVSPLSRRGQPSTPILFSLHRLRTISSSIRGCPLIVVTEL